MAHRSNSVTGRIDDLILRLDTDPEGRARLLSVHAQTRRASLETFPNATHPKPGPTLLGRVRWPYLILDRTHEGQRWVRLAAVATLSLWLVGCTMTVQGHWPGRLNALDRQTGGTTEYHAEAPRP